MMVCSCGTQAITETRRIPAQKAKEDYGLDHELVARHNYCPSCGVGKRSVYQGTHCVLIERANIDLIEYDDG